MYFVGNELETNVFLAWTTPLAVQILYIIKDDES
jgi:hypothetical protein